MTRFWLEPEVDGRIRGVFSSTVKARIGHGETRRSTSQNVLVFVEEQDDGRMAVQSLNPQFVPVGEVKYIGKEKLLDTYIPEPALYVQKVVPAMRDLEETVERAETHYQKGETFSAEYEFKNALRIDEENIRATFGLGLTYLERGETDKGGLVFRRLVALKGAFEGRHKHLFNEFGIKLRRNRMFAEALKYYSRAYQLSKDDEHLLYNMARTLYEKGNHAGAARLLDKALRLRSNFPEALEFKAALERRRTKAGGGARMADRARGGARAAEETAAGKRKSGRKKAAKALAGGEKDKVEVELKDRYKVGI